MPDPTIDVIDRELDRIERATAMAENREFLAGFDRALREIDRQHRRQVWRDRAIDCIAVLGGAALFGAACALCHSRQSRRSGVSQVLPLRRTLRSMFQVIAWGFSR